MEVGGENFGAKYNNIVINQYLKMKEERQLKMVQIIQQNKQKNQYIYNSLLSIIKKITLDLSEVKLPNHNTFKFYYQHRQNVYNWIIKQGKKLKLEVQSLATAIYLADRYHMEEELKPAQFKKIGLIIMIITTKCLQRKVLFTKTIADNNNLRYEEMFDLQHKFLQRMDFRMSQHNYVRTANYYMEKWDEYQNSNESSLYFFRDDVQSYANYQKVIFLCYKFHLFLGNDLEANIVFIVKFVVLLSKDLQQCQIFFENLSNQQPFESIQQQFCHAYEIPPQKQKLEIKYSELGEKMIKQWRKQLQNVDKNARSKYTDQRVKAQDYSIFINQSL